jgi:hypothetical protein
MSNNTRMCWTENTYSLEIRRNRHERKHILLKKDVCARIKERMRANIDVYVWGLPSYVEKHTYGSGQKHVHVRNTTQTSAT